MYRNPLTLVPSGGAAIELSNAAEAQRAVSGLEGRSILGRQASVRLAPKLHSAASRVTSRDGLNDSSTQESGGKDPKDNENQACAVAGTTTMSKVDSSDSTSKLNGQAAKDVTVVEEPPKKSGRKKRRRKRALRDPEKKRRRLAIASKLLEKKSDGGDTSDGSSPWGSHDDDSDEEWRMRRFMGVDEDAKVVAERWLDADEQAKMAAQRFLDEFEIDCVR